MIRPDLTGGKTSVQYAEKHFQPQHRGGGGAEQHQDKSGPGKGWEKGKVGNYCYLPQNMVMGFDDMFGKELHYMSVHVSLFNVM